MRNTLNFKVDKTPLSSHYFYINIQPKLQIKINYLIYQAATQAAINNSRHLENF